MAYLNKRNSESLGIPYSKDVQFFFVLFIIFAVCSFALKQKTTKHYCTRYHWNGNRKKFQDQKYLWWQKPHYSCRYSHFKWNSIFICFYRLRRYSSMVLDLLICIIFSWSWSYNNFRNVYRRSRDNIKLSNASCIEISFSLYCCRLMSFVW